MATVEPPGATTVRAEAVLRLDSPRAREVSVPPESDSPGQDGGCSQDKGDPPIPDVDLSQYRLSFSEYGMPCLDGAQILNHLQDAKSDAGKDPGGQATDLRSVAPLSLRATALLHAINRWYATDTCSDKATDKAADCGNDLQEQFPSTDFHAPPAVVVISPPPRIVYRGRATQPPPSLPPEPALLTFPPAWLPALGRSLMFLDLSNCTRLDPASWDMSLLAGLPHLAMLMLRSAKLESTLPLDLAARLPALRVLDLHDAQFRVPAEQLAGMLIGLLEASDGDAAGTAVAAGGGGSGAGSSDGCAARGRRLVVTAVDDAEESLDDETVTAFAIYSLPAGGGDRGQQGATPPDKEEWVKLTDAAAIRSIRVARERAFLDGARGMWWLCLRPEGARARGQANVDALSTLSLDASMLRLVHDLGLLPPTEDEEAAQAAGGKDGAENKPVGGISAGSKEEEYGWHFRIQQKKRPGVQPRLDDVKLHLSWPFTSPRQDTPNWSHLQGFHSTLRETYGVHLSSRQWRELPLPLAPSPEVLQQQRPQQASTGAAVALAGLLGALRTHAAGDTAGAQSVSEAHLGDPFEVEVVSYGALEHRERLAAATLYAASTGCALGMISGGRRSGTRSSLGVGAELWADQAKARPAAGAPVHLPTPAALSARSLARRMLVAALLGPGRKAGEAGQPPLSLEAVSPAPRGSVSMSMLLVAMRLEGRLFSRVRRVSILPTGHPARAATHASRYWASVQSACDSLYTDPRVRTGVLTGAVPIAAVVELPSAELRSLVAKQKDGRGVAPATEDGGGDAAGGGLLAERTAAAAEAADIEALQKQVSAGGRLDVPVPVFVEDWLPAQRATNDLCGWHIADPRVWPHGSLLHGAVARGNLRCVAWLLDHGLDLNGRISSWDLTPVHLCCMRPCIWRLDGHFLSLLRIPAVVATANAAQGAGPGPEGDGSDGDKDGPGNEAADKRADIARRAAVQLHGARRPQGRTAAHDYEESPVTSMKKALDSGLGLAKGAFRSEDALLFPGVCGVDVRGAGANSLLGPLWYSRDDDIKPDELELLNSRNNMRQKRLQQPFMRVLPCTAPAPTPLSSAAATAGTGVAARDVSGATPAQLLAAASPMLRLLLGRGPDLAARSWCGLQPLHYAAATAGPEAVVALIDAGADLGAPLPGTLVGPLHLFAYRASCRWSGITPRVVARVLSCRPTVPAAVVLGSLDEWGNSPFAWLLMANAKPLGMPVVLAPLLEGLRAALPGGGGDGGAVGQRLTAGVGHASELRPDVVQGVARALAYAIWTVQEEAVRLILRHFPEAAGVALAPLGATPLHIACSLLACGDLPKGHALRSCATGEPLASRLGDMRQDFLTPKPPYIPAGAAGLAAKDKAAAARSAHAGDGSNQGSSSGLLVLGRAQERAAGSQDGGKGAGSSGDDGGEERELENWKKYWPYWLINTGPPHDENAGETQSAVMQRFAAAQLQFAELLLAAGAPVDAVDAAGCTPLMVAALCGTAPLVGLLLAKGASPTAFSPKLQLQNESFSHKRIGNIARPYAHQSLGLNYILLTLPPNVPQPEPRPTSAGGVESRKPARRSASGDGSDDDSAQDESEEKGKEAKDDPGDAWSTWERKIRSRLTETERYADFRLTPLTAAVIRSMQYITCDAKPGGSSSENFGITADGKPADFKLDFVNSNGSANLSMFGDGILWQLLQHGPPSLRESVVMALRHADAESLVSRMPRVALFVVEEAMPGHPYVKYAERAAREASAALSPFTTTSLDAAVQKALTLAIDAGREQRKAGERQPSAKRGGSRGRNGREDDGGGGGADGTLELVPGRRSGSTWGPYEDEVLYDLMLTGVYPLFVSPEMNNGEKSILRMSTQLLHFANYVKVARRALLQAHAQQFTRTAASSKAQAATAAAGDALMSLESSETLLVDTFSTACGLSQQRVRSASLAEAPAAAQAAAATTLMGGRVNGSSGGAGVGDGATGEDAGGGGAAGGDWSSVLAFHTQDDLEYGMTYARVAEVLPPVTSMRAAFGHRAPFPDTVLRKLADTMFKFVRTLCHISQRDLEWVRLPNGVTTAAVDGLFLPVLPGSAEWNITDMFRPNNFGFRLAFSYTRRYLSIELQALTLMRAVPIDIREPAAAPPAAGTGAQAAVSQPGGARQQAQAPSAVDARGGRVGAARVEHNKAEEFKRWMRNPDVVRMQQVQSMAGRLEDVATAVGGNWRQMPVPPVWWITGWVDRFLRLFLLGALASEGDTMKKVKLHTLYDEQVLDPWSRHETDAGRSAADVAVPWSRTETNVLASLLSLTPLKLGDEDDAEDLVGRKLRKKDIVRMRKVMETSTAEFIAAMNGDQDNTDRGCIVFTAQWNKLAERMKWPARSTLEVQDVVARIVRMSSCSYHTNWEESLQSMLSLLMSCDVSPDLRREVEAKLLSLASDAALARRLVWGMCRGRRSEARAVALLSGVLEFQPLLLAALREHEEEAGSLALWHQSDHCWAVAGGPALASLQPQELAELLQRQHELKEPPLVMACNDGAMATPVDLAAGDGVSDGPSSRRVKLMYVCFRSREELQRAVARPLLAGGRDAGADPAKGGPQAGSMVALLPVMLWEAAAVAPSGLPRRDDAVALSFFSLVFSRLPRGLRTADPHAAGSLWGAGLPTVLLCRRPAAHRWSPWGSDSEAKASEVTEEAGVVGSLFAAHAATPLPREWLRELDVSGNGEVSYREFLLAYLRHRAGDFLGPKAVDDDEAASAEAQDAEAAAGPEGAVPSSKSLAAQRWQRATKAVRQGQLSQAFFDQANALRKLREHQTEVHDGTLNPEAWFTTEAKQPPQGPGVAAKAAVGPAEGDGGGGGLAAVRRALGTLGTGDGGGGGPGGSSWLPSVSLAGLDCVSGAELCEVQRCAWIAYANLRSAARYLKAAAPIEPARAPVAAGSSPGPALLDDLFGQTAERAALTALLRCVKEPNALLGGSSVTPGGSPAQGGNTQETGADAAANSVSGGTEAAGSWLDAMSGVVAPAASGGNAAQDGQNPDGRSQGAHPRDCALLELLLDLGAGAGARAVHSDPLSEGLQRPVGPLPGPTSLLLGRTLATAAAQLGADAALELASGAGALAQATAAAAAFRDGLAPPLGGCDEVFAASALRLAAEEVWGFVSDMQALVDRVVSPLVSAADQSVPIIQRDSITAIFGDTNIELILEYETDLLKLLTRQWRTAAPAALVTPTAAGPATHALTAGQRRAAAARLRAYGGDFTPDPEQLQLDRLSAGCQLRAVLTDPGVAEEVLELLQRLATAYQNYINRIEDSLQELRLCLERDSKGTFTALLKRFARPVKPRKERSRAAIYSDTQKDIPGGVKDDKDKDDKDNDEDGEDDQEEQEADSAGEAGKGKAAEGSSGPTVMLEQPRHHAVRPLLSVRQLARYGPGAELEACLRKPAAHLATLAFLASVCRSITAAQEALPELQASSADAPGTVPPGEAAGGARAAPATGTKPPAAATRPAVSSGPLRRFLMRLSGLQVTRVLPLGEGVHPLFQAFCPDRLAAGARAGVAAVAGSSAAEHAVALRGVGAVVLAEEGGGDSAGWRMAGGGRRGGSLRTPGEQLDAWMEQKLLSGGWASRVLLAVCTALVCLTWRVVPLLAERRKYLRDLYTAENKRLHRKLALSLERAINVRPADDEALEAELAMFHAAIQAAVRKAEEEMDLDGADLAKASPMNLDAGFWNTQAPARRQDLEALRAALREAEARQLHSTWAGARLMSNARRCAARMAAAKGGGGDGKDGAANGGQSKPGAGAAEDGGSDSDSDGGDEANRVVDSAVAAKKKKEKQAVAPGKAKQASGKGKEGGVEARDGKPAASALVAALGMFGGSKRVADEGKGEGGGIKAAWPVKGGGIAGVAAAAKRARQFAAALKRAVRRREHARRRWDKTMYLIMQAGSLDEALLDRESAAAVSALRRGAALSAWRQLTGVGDDLLMVFGAVAFRDVGRRFAPFMAAFLGAFPLAVLGVALQLRPDSHSGRLLMGGLVGGYCLYGFAAMAAAVAQLRRDPSQLKVYRPSDTVRFPNFRKGTALASWKAHWVNVFALVTLILEFWQLCAFSYQRRIPYPKESWLKSIFPWALLDLGPAAYFLQVFALLVMMVVWLAVFFPQTPAGLKRVVMPFLGQAAYLTITAGLLSQLNCRLDDGALVRNPDITCWTDPRHVYGAVAAMLALGLYVPRATLTPFEVFFSNANLDVKYRGLYVRMVQLIRLGMAGYNLFFADSYPFTVMVANGCGCTLLAILTAVMRPCCIGAINIMRGTGFVLAAWSQFVSVAALRLSPDVYKDALKQQYYTESWIYVYVLAAGWATIGLGGYLLLRRHLRTSASIRFSLRDSPFNYTRPPPPPLPPLPPGGAAAAPAPAQTGAQGADQEPQADAPAPQQPSSAEGAAGDREASASAATEEAEAGANGNGGGGESDAEDDSKADDSDQEKQDEEDDDEESDGDGSDGEPAADGIGSGGAARPTASGEALGLPVVSPALLRGLAKRGLLTPADEMRAYAAKLVSSAERRLAAAEAGRSDSDDEDGDEEDEDEEAEEEEEEGDGEEEEGEEAGQGQKGVGGKDADEDLEQTQEASVGRSEVEEIQVGGAGLETSRSPRSSR